MSLLRRFLNFSGNLQVTVLFQNHFHIPPTSSSHCINWIGLTDLDVIQYVQLEFHSASSFDVSRDSFRTLRSYMASVGLELHDVEHLGQNAWSFRVLEAAAQM